MLHVLSAHMEVLINVFYSLLIVHWTTILLFLVSNVTAMEKSSKKRRNTKHREKTQVMEPAVECTASLRVFWSSATTLSEESEQEKFGLARVAAPDLAHTQKSE